MPRKPNERLIGIFLISGVAAFIAVMSIFLQQKYFSDNGNMLVMYFEESIKGLNVGSSVVFKGVEIGKVAKIDLIANARSLGFSIPVYVQMDATRSGIYAKEDHVSKREILNALIARGLRARLTSQSYLTGQLMIELEMFPDTKIVLKNKPDDDVLEIPTILSPIGEISKGIQTLPIRESVESFNSFFGELNRQLPVVLPQVTEVFTNLNKVVSDNARASADAVDNINKAAVDVSQAAKALRNFADYIERHPEALLKGKKGY